MDPQEKPESPQGSDTQSHETHARPKPCMRHRRVQSDAARLVWLFQARPLLAIRATRPPHWPSDPNDAAQEAKAPGERPQLRGPSALAQCLRLNGRLVHNQSSLSTSETPPKRNRPNGEPCAGKPLARFG